MKRTIDSLDWDSGNKDKCTKHGLTIEIIEDFFRSNFKILFDPKHSNLEERYIAVGRSLSERPMFVGFAFRYKNAKLLIRPISARYMHEKEATRYEKATSKIEK